MTSKALKAALLTSLLTGSDANVFSRRRTPSDEHDKRARQQIEAYKKKTRELREVNQSERNLKKQQKLAQQSLRHINNMDGKRRQLELAPIAETLPFPNKLKPGDIVKYKGRDGPFRDEEGIQYPSDAVEIIEVIEPAIGPPQYLVANATAPGGEDGPGGPPILVNHTDLEAAPLGRSTLGFLEEFNQLERDIMHDKYKNQALNGTAFPGARVTRDYKGLVRDNKDMVMAPAWEETYSSTFDRQKMMDAQREKTVAASEKLDKSLAKAAAALRAQTSRQARLPTPGIIERIIPSIYSPAADARISEAMSELATVNAALSARNEYNKELQRSRALEADAMVKTGRMMDFYDEAGMTKTPRSLIDEVISPATQLQHTQRLDAQQRMSDWTELQKQNYGPRARTSGTPFSRNKWKRKNIRTRRRAEKELKDAVKRREEWRGNEEKKTKTAAKTAAKTARKTQRKIARDKARQRHSENIKKEKESERAKSRRLGEEMDAEDDGDDGGDEEEEEYNQSINQAAAEATARRADVAAALAPMDDYLPADDDADDDDDDDDIDDEDDVVVDGEIPSAHILKKLLKTINEHKEDDDHDDHEIEINGTPPEERLRAKLQTVLETSTGDGRGRHKSRRHHKKKKKSRRPRKHKNKSTRRRKPKKTKRR